MSTIPHQQRLGVSAHDSPAQIGEVLVLALAGSPQVALAAGAASREVVVHVQVEALPQFLAEGNAPYGIAVGIEPW
jgi:hypothetical protein